MKNNYIDINQKLWNEKTKVHIDSEFYDIKSFKQGKSSLNTVELELLGNIENKNILHLQCHFGLDSMSLSRLGAKVTGVDLSDAAINKAEALKNELSLDTKFIQSDVYTLKDKLHEKFDIVFTSYGVLGWLPDMHEWAKVVGHFLKPGGKLILIEFHPVVWMFSYDFKSIEYAYSSNKAIVETIKGTYTDNNSEIENKAVSWNHGLANVFQSLLDQKLRIEHFKEYNFSPYDCFQNTIKTNENQYQIKGLENKIPMLYSLIAEKK